MGAPSPRCTAEFKQEAVELYGNSGTTYAEVARGLGCDAGACPTGSRRPTRPIAGRAAARSRWPRACAGSSADGPNMARFADIACVKTRQGRLHPAPAMGI